MFKLILMALSSSLSLSISLSANAKDISAKEIINKGIMANYYSGQDRVSVGYIRVEDKKGNILRERRYTQLRYIEGGGTKERDQKLYVYFSEPTDMRGTAYLVHKHIGGVDNRWLRLEKLDLVKRIADTDKRTSFAGTDVLYEDLSGRHLNDDTHELVDETNNYWVVKSTPVKNTGSDLAAHQAWIHKKTFLVAKRLCYNHEGKVYRRFKALKVANVKSENGINFPTIYEAIVEDLRTGTKTFMKGDKIKYNVGLKPELFTQRALNVPPLAVINGFN